jgi:phage gp36-like protein
MFLTPQDYKPYIRDEIKDDILFEDLALIKQVELQAQSQMESYLSGRYDTSKIFVPVLEWDTDKNFTAGQYAYAENEEGSGFVFKALINIPAGGDNPWDNLLDEVPANIVWSMEDPRNPVIVLQLVYMVLYHGHKALPGNRIPQLRIDDYDHAIAWLEKVAEGRLNPILPEAVTEDQALSYWGSETRRNNRF